MDYRVPGFTSDVLHIQSVLEEEVDLLGSIVGLHIAVAELSVLAPPPGVQPLVICQPQKRVKYRKLELIRLFVLFFVVIDEQIPFKHFIFVHINMLTQLSLCSPSSTIGTATHSPNLIFGTDNRAMQMNLYCTNVHMALSGA